MAAPSCSPDRVTELAGYRFVVPVATRDVDFDAQGHLNNAATVRIFNDLRVSYVQQAIGSDWVDTLRREGYVVAAREVHVLYESEGFPGEEFVGAMRYLRREGKAAVLEECLVEASTRRVIARAWVVQLLVQAGSVVEWPESYFDRVAVIEGRAMERRNRANRPFGPGE